MSERGSYSSTEEVADLFRKVEVRLEKAQDEAAGLRWYKRLNPARRKRLNRYDEQLTRARKFRREGDSASAFALLQDIDERYPSVLGLVYGTPRKRENSEEVHELKEERSLKRITDRPHSGGGGGGV